MVARSYDKFIDMQHREGMYCGVIPHGNGTRVGTDGATGGLRSTSTETEMSLNESILHFLRVTGGDCMQGNFDWWVHHYHSFLPTQTHFLFIVLTSLQ